MRKLLVAFCIAFLLISCGDGSDNKDNNPLSGVDWAAIYYPFAGSWTEETSHEKFIFIPVDTTGNNRTDYTYTYINAPTTYTGNCLLTNTMFILYNFNGNTVVYSVTWGSSDKMILYSANTDTLKVFIRDTTN